MIIFAYFKVYLCIRAFAFRQFYLCLLIRNLCLRSVSLVIQIVSALCKVKGCSTRGDQNVLQLGYNIINVTHTHTHTRLTALCPGLPRWAGTRKVNPIWILVKQETVSGSGISWAICKSAHCSRQITTPAPDHSVFYRPDALPAAQPTASKH